MEESLYITFYKSVRKEVEEDAFILDFGCGDGNFTQQMSFNNPSSLIIAYDPFKKSKYQNSEKVKFAKDLMEISYLMDEYNIPQFSMVVSTFVMHEMGPAELFRTIDNYVEPILKNKILIADYNLKGISKNEFKDKFNTFLEIKELEEIGFKESYKIHTRYSLNDCIKSAKVFDYETIETKILDDKFFYWIGQKKDLINGF